MEIIKPAMDLLYFTLGAWAVGGGVMWFTKSKEKLGTSKIGKNLGDMECKYGKKVGFIVAKNRVVKPKRILESILYVGASGSAKTTAAVINNMLSDILPPCSKVIVDLKGEIYKITHKYRESLGEKCYIFEPLGRQVRINPLDFCNDMDEIGDVAQNMLVNVLGSEFDKWDNMASPLLKAALLWAKTLPKQYANIPQVAELLTNNDLADIIKELKSPNDALIEQQLRIFLSCVDSDPTRASILITLLSKLSIYTDPKIKRNLEVSDFTPDQLRRERINIYVKYDLAKVIYLKPILALFNGIMMDRLMQNFDEELFKKGKQYPVLFILDEMQNNGKIPKLPDCINMFRSYKIGVIGLIQSFSKIYDLYGKYGGENLIAGFKTKCVLPGLSDYEALKYFSDPVITGYTEITVTQGKNQTKVKKPLFDGDELRRLPKGKVVIISDNEYVNIADQDRWYESKNYMRRAKQ